MIRKLILVFVVLLTVATPVVAAQENNSSATSTPTPDGPSVGVDLVGDSADRCTETVDKHTSICRSSIDSDGWMTLVVHSDRYQVVTLTDGGAFQEGGPVPRKKFNLREGRNKIEWQITENPTYTGVAIATTNVLYSEPVRKSSGKLLPGNASGSDIAVAASTMFLLMATCIPGAFVMLRRYRGGEHDEF